MRMYRPRRWMLVCALLITAVPLAIKALHSGVVITGWVDAALILMAILGIGAIVEVLISRVELTDNQLILISLTGRRSIAYLQIQQVSLERGRIAIRLPDGAWTKLPEWLSNGQSVAAVLRNRLKQLPHDQVAGD